MKKDYTAQDHTFVVCAYKESPYLEDLIRSLESQTIRGRIMCSTSTPCAFIEDVCERHGLPLAINTGDASIARDWNYGFDRAETPLVTIAHQDDVYEPRYLGRVIEAFNGDASEAGVVHTGYYELRGGERVDDNRLLRVKHRMNSAFSRRMAGDSIKAKRRALSFGCFVCCPSVTFSKAIVGSSVFDMRYENSCDWRTWVNLATRNVRFYYVPEALMGHRIYAESATSQNIESNVRSAEDLELLESLWPKPMARLFFALYSKGEASNTV